jgi:MOSC domain-containing protein YiiM
MTHQTTEILEAGLEHACHAPADGGRVELIVRRPAEGAREVVATAELDLEHGLVGDEWRRRPSRNGPGGGPHPDKQLTLMNARVTALVAVTQDRWPLAGDQLYVDLDLSEANLPVGTRLAVGSAVIEVTDQPHTGCDKFSARFGLDALRFVNARDRRELRLRGMNTRVVEAGVVRAGDLVRKET